LLNQTLEEEKETDKKLTKLAENINVEASAEEDEKESDSSATKRKAARA
jgi:ferritin-like metal-binding protein YciE